MERACYQSPIRAMIAPHGIHNRTTTPRRALTLHHHYHVGGLTLASTLELPNLRAIAPPPAADITIAPGEVPERFANPTASGPTYQIEGQRFLLNVPQVGRYLVEEGCRITYQVVPATPTANLALFLLGSALGACLMQRGLVPLHASVVNLHGQAVAFTGPSGAGKSTLAAWLHHHHAAPVLCDDVAILRIDQQGTPWAYPGAIRMKLWADALHALGLDPATLPKAHSELEKYHAPISEPPLEPLPLRRIYLLHRSDSAHPPGIHPVAAQQAVALLREQSYRPLFLSAMGLTKAHYLHCVALARAVTLHRFHRPIDHQQWPQGLALLHAHLEQERR